MRGGDEMPHEHKQAVSYKWNIGFEKRMELKELVASDQEKKLIFNCVS